MLLKASECLLFITWKHINVLQNFNLKRFLSSNSGLPIPNRNT